MKKIILASFVAAVALLAGCSRNCTVKGYVEGLRDYVYVLDESYEIVDTVTVENGRFTYTIKDMTPAIYVIEGGVGTDEDDMAYFHTKVFVEPGTVRIQTDTTAWSTEYIQNFLSDPRAATIARGTRTNNAYMSLCRDYADILNTTPGFSASKNEMRLVADSLVNVYYPANRDNYLGAYLLNKMKYYYSGGELLAELDTYPAKLQESKIITTLRELGERMVNTDIGQHYIEIVQNDPDGNPISLSSVVENPANKYVLLNFWASWSGACTAEGVYLTQVYDEFHDKGLEIYEVSFDEGLKRWVMFYEKEHMPGIHVSELKGFENQAANDYAVFAIPINLLIETATGTIIAKNLRHDFVYDTISKLFEE